MRRASSMAAALRAPVFAKSAGSGAMAGFTEVPSVQVSSSVTEKVRGGHMVIDHASLSSFNQAADDVVPRPSKEQELHVLEINRGDRNSPYHLSVRGGEKCERRVLGDLFSFTNTLYNADGSKRLGITSGICMLIESVSPVGKEVGYRYEAIYSFYFDNYGHISVQGAYMKNPESDLAITGGSGFFEGVYGRVQLTEFSAFDEISYTMYLKGIPDLPEVLLSDCKLVQQRSRM